MNHPANADIVHCPLCGVPHRAAAIRCDGCAQPLHQPVDVDALRLELSTCRRGMTLGLAGIAVMVGLNVIVGGRAGAMVFFAAPVAWLVKNGVRYRAVRAALTKLSGGPTSRSSGGLR